MGENQPNSIRRAQAIKQHRLSDAMIAALDTGRNDNGTANVIGRVGTTIALVERGLITTGRTHQWTQLGYDVAARVLSGRVPAYDDGHPLDERVGLADGPVDIEAQAEAAAREVSASGGGLDEWARRQQLAGRSLRTQADHTTEAAPASPLSRERIEPGDLVTVDGADRRVWRVESVDDGRGTMSGESWAELAHALGTRTSIPVKRLTHATPGEIMGRPAPRFAVGDRVTINGLDRDRRVWRIASVVPGDPDGRPVPVRPWASLTHEASRYETITTTANLDRLVLALEPATSQPATSQIGQQLADLAELIRTVRQVDPDLSRAVERAKYDTLRAFLRVLTGSIETATENCAASGHGGPERHDDGYTCGSTWHVSDIRSMVNTTARDLGIRATWAPEATS